jgi:hypothetical protein
LRRRSRQPERVPHSQRERHVASAAYDDARLPGSDHHDHVPELTERGGDLLSSRARYRHRRDVDGYDGRAVLRLGDRSQRVPFRRVQVGERPLGGPSTLRQRERF